MPTPRLRIEPLTAERWADFEQLFGPRGACGGCWCMTPKLDSATYERSKGAGNKARQKRYVRAGHVPGLLAYAGDEAVGWCAVEPREVYGRLQRSRVLAPVDAEPVWSIVCFYVRKDWRGRGLQQALTRGAEAWAAQHGARLLEGYPQAPKRGRMPDVFAWTGLLAGFVARGFREVARRSATRPIMRKVLRGRR